MRDGRRTERLLAAGYALWAAVLLGLAFLGLPAGRDRIPVAASRAQEVLGWFTELRTYRIPLGAGMAEPSEVSEETPADFDCDPFESPQGDIAVLLPPAWVLQVRGFPWEYLCATLAAMALAAPVGLALLKQPRASLVAAGAVTVAAALLTPTLVRHFWFDAVMGRMERWYQSGEPQPDPHQVADCMFDAWFAAGRGRLGKRLLPMLLERVDRADPAESGTAISATMLLVQLFIRGPEEDTEWLEALPTHHLAARASQLRDAAPDWPNAWLDRDQRMLKVLALPNAFTPAWRSEVRWTVEFEGAVMAFRGQPGRDSLAIFDAAHPYLGGHYERALRLLLEKLDSQDPDEAATAAIILALKYWRAGGAPAKRRDEIRGTIPVVRVRRRMEDLSGRVAPNLDSRLHEVKAVLDETAPPELP